MTHRWLQGKDARAAEIGTAAAATWSTTSRRTAATTSLCLPTLETSPRWSRCWPRRLPRRWLSSVARRHSASHRVRAGRLATPPLGQARSTPPRHGRLTGSKPTEPTRRRNVAAVPRKPRAGRRSVTSLDARHLRPVEAALRTPPPPGLENPRGPFTPAPTAAHDPGSCPTLPPRAGTSARPLSTADPLPKLVPTAVTSPDLRAPQTA